MKLYGSEPSEEHDPLCLQVAREGRESVSARWPAMGADVTGLAGMGKSGVGGGAPGATAGMMIKNDFRAQNKQVERATELNIVEVVNPQLERKRTVSEFHVGMMIHLGAQRTELGCKGKSTA